MRKHYWLKRTEAAIHFIFIFRSQHKELPRPNTLPVTILATQKVEFSSE